MTSGAHPRTTDDASGASPTAAPALGDADARLGRLGNRIAELSARIQSATYELLVPIREFDQQEGWDGRLSCAAWLSWRTGLAPGSAGEHVRVARALGELPKLSDAVRQGAAALAEPRDVPAGTPAGRAVGSEPPALREEVSCRNASACDFRDRPPRMRGGRSRRNAGGCGVRGWAARTRWERRGRRARRRAVPAAGRRSAPRCPAARNAVVPGGGARRPVRVRVSALRRRSPRHPPRRPSPPHRPFRRRAARRCSTRRAASTFPRRRRGAWRATPPPSR